MNLTYTTLGWRVKVKIKVKVKLKVKIKVKFNLQQARKVQWGSKGVALLFL